MKRIYKTGLTVILGIVLTVCMTGCSVLNMFTKGDFDASGYVQGILDATYKGEFTQYLELTEDTEEKAKEAYEKVMEAKAEAFATFTGVTLNDESKQKFIEYSKKIYANAKYTVGEAEKKEDSYVVQVTVSPMLVLNVIEARGSEFVDEFNAKNENGDFADYTQEAFEAEYVNGIMKIFDENIDSVEYGADEIITLNVVLDSDKYYTVDSAEFAKVDAVVIENK